MTTEVFEEKPEDFNGKVEVVGCIVEYGGEILLLHRLDHKLEGNKWGFPSGKIDEGENPEQAIIREISEETGIKILKNNIKLLKKLYVRYPEYDFVYYLFYTKVDNKIVKIKPDEHKGFVWVSPEKALKMPIVNGSDYCIEVFQNEKKK